MALELQHIHYQVAGQTYLEDINLSFESGQFNVLLGRTLAGKTSLMRIIAGLDKPSSGKVILNGRDITSLPVQQRNVSMVYQQFINYPHMSVFDNIASPLRVAKLDKIEIARRVRQTAELLRIDNLLSSLPLSLSGGQQQRCAMARALVKDADLILFDEPLVNLDYKLREELRSELKTLFKQRNAIALYASTEAHEALALGGTTTLLHQGRVLQSGAALQQFYHPQSLDAADLYHEPPFNRLKIAVKNGQCDALPSLTLPWRDGEQCIGLRPDHLTLTSQCEQDIPLQCVVELSEISASETYLHLLMTPSFDMEVRWIAHLDGIHNFKPGSEVTLFFNPQHLYCFDVQGGLMNSPDYANLQRGVTA